jgi:hypothetical protein
MKCRCGHGRTWHYATANAFRKRRRPAGRPYRAPQAGCRWIAGATGRKVCPCRNYHPEPEPLTEGENRILWGNR